MKVENVHIISNYSNSFIIEFKEYLILVDAGFDKTAKKISEKIESLKKPLKCVLITHSHLDHIRGLEKIKETFPLSKIVAHMNAKEYIEGRKMLFPKGIKGTFFKLFSPFIGYRGVNVDIFLKDGERIGEIKAVETPGHTNCSLSFLWNKNLFIGDLLTNEKNKLSFPPKEFNQDEDIMATSLKKLLKEKFSNVFFGHGNSITGNGKEAIKNFIEEKQL